MIKSLASFRDAPLDAHENAKPITLFLKDREIRLAICFQARGAAEHLMAFEQAMQALLDARQKSDSSEAYIVLDVEAIEHREAPSYRAALKKYSNSIVFVDLQIGLLLVGSRGVSKILPEDVNGYLRNLDKHFRTN